MEISLYWNNMLFALFASLELIIITYIIELMKYR